MIRKCYFCKQSADWIMQYLEGNDPVFVFPGSHYRGFKTFRACDKCKEKIAAKGPIEKKDLADQLFSGKLEPLG